MSEAESRAQEIFLTAQKQSDEMRDAFLQAACAGDASLLAEVDKLMISHQKSGGSAPPIAGSSGTVGESPEELAAKMHKAPPLPPTDLKMHTIAGRYKMIHKLGEGGMGEVWMAEQREPVKRSVAVKLIKSGMDSKKVLARFEAERQALALMDHPNIAKVFDGGTTDYLQPFFVMELVKGVPITQYCDDAQLSPRERLELFIPVCQAVQHAHQKGIIHRDLKPSNVLVALTDGKPAPKIIDFGIAKAITQKLTDNTIHTELGGWIGTLEYMAPEQAEINNLDIDTRADIYSLGVMLYELLSGEVPFSRKQLRQAGYNEMLRMIREAEPSKPSTKLSSSDQLPSIAARRKLEPRRLTKLVSGELDWISMKCLEKERNRRYETANGLALDIERYLHDEPVQAGPPSTSYRLRKFYKRNRGAVIAAVAFMVILIAGIVGTTWGLLQARESERLTRLEKQRADAEARRAREQEAEAKKQEGFAQTNAQEAGEQRQLTLETLRGVIDDIDAQLKNVPAQQTLRKKLLQNALAGLKRVARHAETASRADREQMKALHELGDIFLLLEAGGTEDANKLFQLALKIAEDLAKSEPRTIQAQQDLALSLQYVGDGQMQQGDISAALVSFQLSLEIREKLLKENPFSLPAHRDFSSALDRLGDVQLRMGEGAKALVSYQRSVEISEMLADVSFHSTLTRRNLAISLNRLGEVQIQQGDAAAALATYKRSVAINEKLAKADPTDAQLQRDWLVSSNKIGRVQMQLGEGDAALASFEQALTIGNELMKADPQNTQAQRDLSATLDNVAEIQLLNGSGEKALESYQQSLDISAKLA